MIRFGRIPAHTAVRTAAAFVATLLPAQQAPPQKSVLTELSESLEAVAAKVSPAVVQVLVSGFRTSARGPSGPGVVTREQGTGSGVILDPEGYIITNNHVVEGSTRVRVLLSNQLSPRRKSANSVVKPAGAVVEATVVGADHETDLAVLKIERKSLPFLRLEDSEYLRQGQIVLAFGSPMGLQNSVTLGVVSSVARQMQTDDPMIYIQTDAPINPGSSGGPLLDTHGHVVGINTFIFSQSGGHEGLGFAVPSNVVKNVYQQIRKNGRVIRGEIGVNANSITPVLALGLDLPRDSGVVLADVFPESTAGQAGLKPNDIVLTLDGKRMENARQFDVGLYGHSDGDVVKMEVQRGDDRLTFAVTVRARQDGVEKLAAGVSVSKDRVAKLNILGMSLTQEITKMLPELRSTYGVVVAALTFDPLSPDVGLQPGDVIAALNGMPVSSIDTLREALGALKPGDPVVLKVERDQRFIFLSFENE